MPSYRHGVGRPYRLTDSEMADLYAAGLDSDSIAVRAGCAARTVLEVVRAAGIPVRRPGSKLHDLRIPEAEIVQRYHAGDSGPVLGRLAGCCAASIYVILRRHGVTVRDRNPAAAAARAKRARARRVARTAADADQ